MHKGGQAVEVRILCNQKMFSVSEQQTWNLLAREPETCTRTHTKVKRNLWSKNSFDFPKRRLERQLSHLCQIANKKINILLWTAASLHMMRKGALTFVEKDTIRKSREPTVIATAKNKAKSTKQATTYANDLDIFCIWVYLSKTGATPGDGKRESLHR